MYSDDDATTRLFEIRDTATRIASEIGENTRQKRLGYYETSSFYSLFIQLRNLVVSSNLEDRVLCEEVNRIIGLALKNRVHFGFETLVYLQDEIFHRFNYELYFPLTKAYVTRMDAWDFATKGYRLDREYSGPVMLCPGMEYAPRVRDIIFELTRAGDMCDITRGPAFDAQDGPNVYDKLLMMFSDPSTISLSRYERDAIIAQLLRLVVASHICGEINLESYAWRIVQRVVYGSVYFIDSELFDSLVDAVSLVCESHCHD